MGETAVPRRAARPVRAPGPGVWVAVLAGLAGVAFSCRDPAGPEGSDTIIVAFEADTSTYPRDDWRLVDGAVVGDSLELTVEHAGGCEEHAFWLLAVDGWVDFPDAGLTPTVGVPLELAHDARGDACEALITRPLSFHLAPLEVAFRERYGTGPATLLLQLPAGRDAAEVHTFGWTVNGS